MDKPREENKDTASAREATQKATRPPEQKKREGPDHGRDEVSAGGDPLRN